MTQESSDVLNLRFSQLNVGGGGAPNDESEGSISPLHTAVLPEPGGLAPNLKLSEPEKPPSSSMLSLPVPVVSPPRPPGGPSDYQSLGEGATAAEHAAKAAELARQIEALNQQLAYHQCHARREEQKARELKQAEELLSKGLDEDGNRLTSQELQELKKSQEPALARLGPVWKGVQLLQPSAVLLPLGDGKLAEAVNSILEVDSSDSENEYDNIEDLESTDDEEEEEEDEGDNQDDDESEGGKSAWQDDFPFEENLFRLSQHYNFVRRLATNDDAVVYEAVQKTEPFLPVAIKISQRDDEDVPPKAVTLLSAVTGHPNLNRLLCWHPLPTTECYCIVTELVPNDIIFDWVVGRPESIKKYMRDTLAAVEHCHARGVLFRDVKPDNIMWSHDRQCAVIIDFDVATFIRPQGHRAVVGSDGYMAPEVVAINKAKTAWKKKKALERKEEKKRQAALLAAKKNEARKGKFRANASTPAPKKLTEQVKEPDEEEEEEEEVERKRPSLEELGAKPYGTAVDVFSCGVVLGQLLFNISDEFVLDYPDHNQDSMHDHFARLIAKEENLQVGHDLILKMTDKDPTTRITIPEVSKHPYFTNDEKEAVAVLENLKQQNETLKSGGLRCFGCGLMLSKEQFSKNQLKKKGTKVNSRRCLACAKDKDDA